MHRLGQLMAVLIASFAMLSVAFAEDPSDIFLKAYQDFQNGEKLEREAKPRAALEKYRSAQQLLQKIKEADADWQPLVVGYRLKKTQENVSRLEGEVANLPPDAIEGPLPEAEPEKPALPTVSSEPVVTTRPPSSSSRRSTPTTRIPESLPPSRSGGTASERELRNQVAQLRAENERLSERLLKKSADLQSAQVEVDRTKVTVVELKSQLAQANATLEDSRKDDGSFVSLKEKFEKRIAELFKQLTDTQADNEVLQEENARLYTKLDRASKYIADSDEIRKGLLKERQSLADERDTAVAKVKKIKDNSAEIERVAAENKKLKQKISNFEETTIARTEYEKLATENKTLAKKLTDAEENSASKSELKKLAAAKAEMEEKLAQAEKALQEKAEADPNKDKLIASLQSELNGVNDRLLESQAQVSHGEEQLKVLQKQLDETSGELAQMRLNPAPTKEEKTLTAENDLLRGIILRQIKEQARRDEAKKSIEQEMANLQVKSDVLSQQLAILGAPVLQLTPEERSLFKEPVALLNEPNPMSLEVTMAVTKPTEQEAIANNTPAEPEGPDALPDDVRQLVQKAKQLFEEKNYQETERVYQQIVDRLPNNYFALSNLGAVQIEGGKLSAAEVALKKAIEINNSDSFAYTSLGILYCRQGKFEDAVAALRKSLEISDKDAVAHNYLGVCLAQKDHRNEAEREFKKATELNPDYPDAHFNLAVLYATTQPQSMELAKHHYVRATELGAAPDPSLERLIQ